MPAPVLISVITPVYNAETYLDRAIETVLRQDYPHWEHLLVDDCSTDKSVSILASYVRRDKRIRSWRRATNSGGPSAPRNGALAQARGEWVAYLDSDDEYYPDYLERIAALANSKVDLLAFPYDVLEERKTENGYGRMRVWEPKLAYPRMATENIMVPLGVAHRIELYKQYGGFDPAIHYDPDWDLWKRLASLGVQFGFPPFKSGVYHVRKESLARRIEEARE